MVETSTDGSSDPTAAAAAAKSYAWGISDQNAADVNDSRYGDLKVKFARFQMGYDTFTRPASDKAAAATRADFAAWLAAVQRPDRGIIPLVTFQKSRGSRASISPTVDSYRNGVRAFFAAYPNLPVKYFTAWNEPNIIRKTWQDPLSKQPELAAQVYKVLFDECRARGCSVAAGEYVDDKNMKSYHTAYMAEIKRLGVPVYHWAVHAYWTGNHHNLTRLNELIKATSKNSSIWLTEQGGVVTIGKKQVNPSSDPNDPSDANDDLAFLLKLPGKFPRIKRFYVYEFKGTASWDSGLISRAGNTRAMYTTFKNRPNP